MYVLTPAQQRVLNILFTDTVRMYDSLPEVEWNEAILKITKMKAGLIAFEEMNYNVEFVSHEEIPGEEQYTVWFYGDIRNEREIKQCLTRSFNLVHFPHACKTQDNSQPDVRRFKVENVTNEAVSIVFNANRHLFFFFNLQLSLAGVRREKQAKRDEKKQQQEQAKQEKKQAKENAKQEKQEQPKRKYTKRGEKKENNGAPKRKYTRKNAKKEAPTVILLGSNYDSKYEEYAESDSKFYGYDY